ncbi:MAG: hypothetical protein QF570_11420 [Myxococcota bacterium]|jgi:hypothetical protein|nr:hypothetical protein [Myxococcota bacterium]
MNARALYVALFVATVLFQLPYFDRWYALLDEGHILMFADIVARGGEIYRDATIYPLPGAFYLLAQVFEWFGPSIRISRWIVVFEFALFVPLVFAWMRRLVPMRWALLGVAVLWLWRIWCFPHWQMYSYSTTSLLFLLGSMMCLLTWFRDLQARWLYGAGVLFGMGVACKQDYGAALLLAAGLTLGLFAASRLRDEEPGVGRALAGFVLPGAGVGALLGLYFLVKGVLPDLVQMTVFNHMRGLATFGYPEIPDLWPLFGQDPGLRGAVGFFNYFPGLIFTLDAEGVRNSTLFRETWAPDLLLKAFYYGPHAIALAGGARLWSLRANHRDPERREAFFAELLLYAFALGMLLVLTFNKPQDYVHFAVVYWPFLVLGVVYVQASVAAQSTKLRAAGWGLAAAAAVPGLFLSLYGVSLLAELRATNAELVGGERAGVYASPTEGRVLDEIVDYVHANTEPEDRVAVIPYFPIVQFLMDRLGPHRSAYIVWPFPEFDDRDARIVRAMEADATDVVIYNFTQFVNFPLMSEFAPELFAYVVDHYEMDQVFSYDHAGYMLAALRRRAEPAARERVVGDAQREGDMWIERELGPGEPLPPGARATAVETARWPFRPTLAVLPGVGAERNVYAVEVDVPADGARLESAFGVNPRAWFMHPPSDIRYRVELVDGTGEEHLLIERTLQPHTEFQERGWSDFVVDLAPFAGQRVELRFSTSVEHEEAVSIWLGGIEVPRVVAASAPALM